MTRYCALFVCLSFFVYQSASAQLPNADKLSDLKKDLTELVKSFGQLENADGKCLDIAESEQRKNGGKVHIQDCDGSATQKWQVQDGKVISSAEKCLTVDGDPAKHGEMLYVWSCDKGKSQQWELKGGKLVNSAGKCLDVAGDRKKNDSRLRIADCNDDGDKRWKFKK